jgi:hypothetical protein
MNLCTAKRLEEKLNYMQNNPVKRGLVKRERVPGTCEKIGFTDFSTTHFQ